MMENINISWASWKQQKSMLDKCTDLRLRYLTHWGRDTYICVSVQVNIGSDNDLSPIRHKAIIWTNAGILSIGPLGTKFNEILIDICTLSFKKMHLKMLSAKWRPFCLDLNVLIYILIPTVTHANHASHQDYYSEKAWACVQNGITQRGRLADGDMTTSPSGRVVMSPYANPGVV